MNDDDVQIIRVTCHGPRLGERIVTEGIYTPAAEVEAAWDRAMYRIPVMERPKSRSDTPAYKLWEMQRARARRTA